MAPQFKKPSFQKPQTAKEEPQSGERSKVNASGYSKVGRGYVSEGKKGNYIKIMLDEDCEPIGPGEYLFLFENSNKKGEKSPDYFLSRKAAE